MQISRIDLADKGSPEGIVMAILKAEPDLPIPVPIEELCGRLDIIEIQALTTQGFEGGLLTDRERSRGIVLVRNGVSSPKQLIEVPAAASMVTSHCLNSPALPKSCGPGAWTKKRKLFAGCRNTSTWEG
jgi:hypothetical protein